MLLCLALVTVAGGCGGDDGERSRVLLIGWDGATFAMIDPLLAAGHLPNVRALVRHGVATPLRSTIVPISAAAWPAAMTGKSPGQTGVYGFFEPVEGTYDVRLVSARSNHAAPLWRILSRRGRTTHVVGVPITYPPEPIRGTFVAGMLSPPDAVYTQPPGLSTELRRVGFTPDLDSWRRRQTISWSRIEEYLAVKQRLLIELVSRDDWDLCVFVFKSLDVLSHLFYDGSPDTDVARLYTILDRLLGELIEAAGPGVNVVLMSDHGFKTFDHDFNLHAWLVETGFATRRDRQTREPARELPIAEQRVLAHRARLDELDLTRSVAFAGECQGSYGSLRLNVRGREPHGCVDPADVEDVVSRIRLALQATRTADGQPLVTRTWRGTELYPGEHASVLPDVIFRVDERFRVTARREGPVLSTPDTPVRDHALDGILIAAGPAVTRGSARVECGVADIAPTVLHLLGEPIYTEMTGRVLTEILTGSGAPVVIDEADEVTGGVRSADESYPYSEEELEGLLDQLKTLGYTQ